MNLSTLWPCLSGSFGPARGPQPNYGSPYPGAPTFGSQPGPPQPLPPKRLDPDAIPSPVSTSVVLGKEFAAAR